MSAVATSPVKIPARDRFAGARNILLFNRHQYLAAALALTLGGIALCLPALPGFVRLPLMAALALILYWSLASIAVSYYVYDYSPLYRWEWLPGLLPRHPARWATLHCGLDDAGDTLKQLFPHTDSVALDFFEPKLMTERSIERARELAGNTEAQRVDFAHLPFDDESFETLFLIFAAHELRSAPARLEFFEELQRVLQPGGRLILVEHLRDTANFLAFGPGFMHFLPRSEWRRLAACAGFISAETKMTPFVSVFVLSKTSDQ